MFSSILYKEFLKTYKVIALFSILIIYSLFQTFLDAKNTIEFYDATSAILGISQMGRFDFNNIHYFCFLFAIALGVAQYYPEVSQARIRLYLHLPMSHKKLISIILFSGIAVLLVFFAFVSLFYYLILNAYYPAEIFEALYSKLIPMFLGSIFCYLAVVLGFLEPKISRKVIYLFIAYSYISILVFVSQNGYFISYLINTTLVVMIFVYILTAYEVFTAYTKGYIKWKT